MTKAGIRRSQLAGLAIFFTVAILSSPVILAVDGPPPAAFFKSPAVAITIDSENLIELYQSVPGLKIIDSRYREDHVQGYIETSLNLPLIKTDCQSLARLVENQDQAMVFYCNGNAADASVAAIQIAARCGYQRLFWFRGGFVEWQDKDYPYLIE